MPTDIYLVKTAGFTILIAIVCICQCCLICLSGFTAQQIARRIATTDEQDDKMKEQKKKDQENNMFADASGDQN